MSTRALIGYLDTSRTPFKLTTTYNHYDGYPSNLGRGLEEFYNEDDKAYSIADQGYISFLDGETGEWENTSNSNRPSKVTQLPNDFGDAMEDIAEKIDSAWGSYGYIWDNEKGEWITVKNTGIRSMALQLEKALFNLKDKFEATPGKTMEAKEELDEAFVHQMKYKAGIIK